MRLNSEPLLQTTRQAHKVRNAGIAFCSGAALAAVPQLAQWAGANVSDLEIITLGGPGLSLILGAYLYVYYSVRCPQCRLAWVRWALAHQPRSQWLIWLKSFSVCPGCGYPSSRRPNDPSAT